jgi:CheY-like chemotaxis protein
MPGIDGLTALKLVRKRFPDVIVVILSGIDSDGRGSAGGARWRSKRVQDRVRDPCAASLVPALGQRRACDGMTGLPPAEEERDLDQRLSFVERMGVHDPTRLGPRLLGMTAALAKRRHELGDAVGPVQVHGEGDHPLKVSAAEAHERMSRTVGERPTTG